MEQRHHWPGLTMIAVSLLLAGCNKFPAASATQPAPTAAAAHVQPAAGAAANVLVTPEPPPFSVDEWQTDFTRRTVAWEEILSGGPPKDGIPAIDAPSFQSVAAATWLSDRDPVIVFADGEEVRAYPLDILIWHEIVNDMVGGRPVAVTFCSDLIMYDRQAQLLAFDHFWFAWAAFHPTTELYQAP